MADARAATALVSASLAVVLADARNATLSARVLCAIVVALFADPQHLQSALCFLLLLDETSQHSMLLRQDERAPFRQAGWGFFYSAHEPVSAGSCGLSTGSEAQASPSSLTEKQGVLVG